MKRLIVLIAVLLLPVVAEGQVSSSTARRVRGGSSAPPATCRATNPIDVYIRSGVTLPGFYYCSATNTWTGPLPTSAATISGLVTGQYVKAASATTIQTDGVKRYVALLSQTGTDAPTATVLENSLGGTVVWTRNSAGNYTGTLAGAFTASKTVAFIGPLTSNLEGVTEALFSQASANTVSLTTRDVEVSVGGSALQDEMLNGTSVMILVYP